MNDEFKQYNLPNPDEPSINKDVLTQFALGDITQKTTLLTGSIESAATRSSLQSQYGLFPTYQTLTAIGLDGSDGPVNIASGTTTVDTGAVAVLTKYYSSITITGTGSLAFSNPHANGTVVFIRCQADATITSSATSAINLDGLGAVGGTVVSGDTNGNNGTAGVWYSTADYGDGALFGGSGTVGPGGTAPLSSATVSRIQSLLYILLLIPGGGGGGGASIAASGGNSGAGGRGGGACLIQVIGALIFTATVTAKGAAGTNTTGSGGNGGGGGGGGGMFYIVANTITTDTGTITCTGGAAGTDPNNTSRGGGGGASAINNGATPSANGDGGAGGDGTGDVISLT